MDTLTRSIEESFNEVIKNLVVAWAGLPKVIGVSHNPLLILFHLFTEAFEASAYVQDCKKNLPN